MIEPTAKDIGRFVLYSNPSPITTTVALPTVEPGRVIAFSDKHVLVRFVKRFFDETITRACDRESLTWLDDLLAKAAHPPDAGLG